MSLRRRSAAWIGVTIPVLCFFVVTEPASAGHTVRRHASPRCFSVYYIGAAGSGELRKGVDTHHMGVEVEHMRKVLGQRLREAGLGQMGSEGVRYPADSTSELYPDATTLALIRINPGLAIGRWATRVHKYFRSIDKGIAATVKQAERAMSVCPASGIVLAGYSQGAMVVHDAELRLARVPGALAHIAGTLLLADGDRVRNSSAVPFGSAGQGGEGIRIFTHLLGNGRDVPAPSTTASICERGDVVCDTSFRGLVTGFAIHTGYYTHHRSLLDEAATWLAGKIIASHRPATPPPPPAYGTGGGRSSPPFDECPAVGAATGCSVLIVVAANGQQTLLTDPSQPAYDSQDDTLVGILNQSSTNVSSVPLSGSDIFDFDDDGMCSGKAGAAPSGCPFGSTGYEGPGTVLTANPGTVDAGTVSFPGGLLAGDSTYFSLEGTATSLVARPPIVTTGQATSITESEATINGTVNPQGDDTTYYVEYGTDTSYGSTSDSAMLSGAASESPQGDDHPVQIQLAGLDAGTTYHYRLVATNSEGTTYGSDATFTTTQPVPMDAYNNYGPASAGHPMCRGNPGNSASMPGGSATQTFTIPQGMASITSALVQIDPDASVTAHAQLIINGNVAASVDATAAGDTHFNFGSVPVQPGDQAALSISFTASYGKIITIYSAANVGGTLSGSNSCPGDNISFNTGNGLRAVISGMSD